MKKIKAKKEKRSGSRRWTSGWGLTGVVIMLMLYTIFCYVIIDRNAIPSEDSARAGGQIEMEEKLLVSGKEENRAICEPNSKNKVEWECGIYYNDISAEDMEAFLIQCRNEGWSPLEEESFLAEIREGTTTCTLVRKDEVLQMMMVCADKKETMNNSILVRLDQGISREMLLQRGGQNHDALLENIQRVVDERARQQEIPYDKKKVTGLFEIFIPEAYEKLNLQAYAAVGERGFIGCFLVRSSVVSYMKGSLENACVADIDEDEAYEVVDLYTEWVDGLYQHMLVAYRYENPEYFNSYTQVPVVKYSNCYVSEGDYEMLSLVKREGMIYLKGEQREYGAVIPQGKVLVPEDMANFPYVVWDASYNQERLLEMDKTIPQEPPEITVSYQGVELEYMVKKTDWEGEQSELTMEEAYGELSKKEFLPTVSLENGILGTRNQTILLDFGKSMPDSITVKDAMLGDSGMPRYGSRTIMELAVKILDKSKVSFRLSQHMSYYLSSNLEDYERDWLRLFEIVCRWDEKECVYAFIINTGKEQQLTKVKDSEFLVCDGSYSVLSSNWGLGIGINTRNLPEDYLIEWQVDGGNIRKWNASTKRPEDINEEYNGHPMTRSKDADQGAILWNPVTFDDTGEVTVRAFLYKKEGDKSPIAYSQIILVNIMGVYQRKQVD